MYCRLKLYSLYQDLRLDDGGGLPLFQKWERAPVKEQLATTATAQQGMWKLNYLQKLSYYVIVRLRIIHQNSVIVLLCLFYNDKFTWNSLQQALEALLK